MKKTCSRGKHSRNSKRKKLNKKKVVFIGILFIVFTFSLICILRNTENTQLEETIDVFKETNNEEVQNELDSSTFVEVDMPNKIEDYNVIGQLVIDRIELKKYILSKTTTDSLKLSITKLYGPKVNGKGNLCIIGHNATNQFIKLKKLKIGNTFYIIDKERGEKITYKIYDKYTVVPTNLDCLAQNTKDKREVTLITCNPRRVN